MISSRLTGSNSRSNITPTFFSFFIFFSFMRHPKFILNTTSCTSKKYTILACEEVHRSNILGMYFDVSHLHEPVKHQLRPMAVTQACAGCDSYLKIGPNRKKRGSNCRARQALFTLKMTTIF
jgi:hypothetical protein